MATDTITQQTADKVAAAIARAGVSKTKVSNDTGIPYSTLGRKLDGDTPITVADLFRIAKAIGAQPYELAPTELTSSYPLAS